MKTRRAFTLIEMLVVLAIISIVATMVVGLNARAQELKRKAAVETEKQSLIVAIQAYQSKLNYYPPDNGNLVFNAANPSVYDATAATNPLIYELTGATNNYPQGTGNIQLFDGTNVQSSYYSTYFGRPAVNNSSTDEPHNFFYNGPKAQEVGFYDSAKTLKGLLVPVPGTNDPNVLNFWHYDSSTTNRHNLSSYDLWAEFIVGGKGGTPIIITNGNW